MATGQEREPSEPHWEAALSVRQVCTGCCEALQGITRLQFSMLWVSPVTRQVHNKSYCWLLLWVHYRDEGHEHHSATEEGLHGCGVPVVSRPWLVMGAMQATASGQVGRAALNEQRVAGVADPHRLRWGGQGQFVVRAGITEDFPTVPTVVLFHGEMRTSAIKVSSQFHAKSFWLPASFTFLLESENSVSQSLQCVASLSFSQTSPYSRKKTGY